MNRYLLASFLGLEMTRRAVCLRLGSLHSIPRLCNRERKRHASGSTSENTGFITKERVLSPPEWKEEQGRVRNAVGEGGQWGHGIKRGEGYGRDGALSAAHVSYPLSLSTQRDSQIHIYHAFLTNKYLNLPSYKNTNNIFFHHCR